MNWVTTVLPLAGVVLGSSGTLIGQYLSTRVDARREQHEHRVAERAERKQAIMDFLSAAQKVELLSDEADSGSSPDSTEIRAHLHALWLAKKLPELVCSTEVAQAAHDYTLALHELVRGRAAPGDEPRKRELRYAFMEAARGELGAMGGPLRRRFAGDAPPGLSSQENEDGRSGSE
ncbi:hypothetical protein ACRYCC_08270 [Actinomadura scrupuli]|uniref:hypothetical protein n=1 Tax=Actinomadura scrupuli TaxID=559629 RepID=UPI003D97AB15